MYIWAWRNCGGKIEEDAQVHILNAFTHIHSVRGKAHCYRQTIHQNFDCFSTIPQIPRKG